ncbi:MAG: exopolyphosphatase [Planctomycetota bacterium]|jgi:oligoribonuclease NrnB/cAMP/cGMP phosphodiesterase (DHH superfamily)
MRLITRCDLDGLTCAVLISLHEEIDELLLAHPQDLVDGRVEVRTDDIIANLPYRSGCALWFDHHMHTTAAPPTESFEGVYGKAPSAARLVYDYYGGSKAMPDFDELVRQTDRLDSADLSLDDVLVPQEYIKLGFTLDTRSGLGPMDEYFRTLLRMLVERASIGEILAHPEVERRTSLLESGDVELHTALVNHSEVLDNVLFTDFRSLESVPVGNRFLVFALFPAVNVAVRVQWNGERTHPMLTIGHSILNRTCNSDVGEIAARYGGGGHKGAASVRLMEDPDQQIQMIVADLQAKG